MGCSTNPEKMQTLGLRKKRESSSVDPDELTHKSHLIWITLCTQPFCHVCGVKPLKPITTAADDKFCDIFPNFRKNKV